VLEEVDEMCKQCGSGFLMIRRKTFIEGIMIVLTGKRKYFCQDCGLFFRAPDRRRVSREAPVGAVILSAK
jgi:hypothetical protein